MKIVLVVVGLTLAVAAEIPIIIDYHEKIGIPEAARIKRSEEARDFDGSRITGGQISALADHPHLGGLVVALTDGRTSTCGSSLVTNTKLVTAAHCWRNVGSQARQFTVVLGSTNLYSGGHRIGTNNVQLHANYNLQNLNNDIAIITIRHVSYTNVIRPINIASGNNNYAGTWAVAAGYGRLGDGPAAGNELKRKANLQVIVNSACASSFASGVVIGSSLCTSTTNGQSICSGDSGGPLYIGSGNGRLLIGVSSFGSTLGCTSRRPAVFARVTSFASWIRARI